MTRASTHMLRFLAGSLLMLGLLFSCSETSRYRVLSFVFDGVPPPPGMAEEMEGEEAEDLSPFRASLQQLEVPKTEMAPQIQSVHEPYLRRQCRECHDSPLKIDQMPRDASLCDRCHLQQRVSEGWDHGPINLGTCIPCHVPHSSIHPNLLTKPVPELCQHCHQEEEPRPEYHAVPNYEQCTECHDPHTMY